MCKLYVIEIWAFYSTFGSPYTQISIQMHNGVDQWNPNSTQVAFLKILQSLHYQGFKKLKIVQH